MWPWPERLPVSHQNVENASNVEKEWRNCIISFVCAERFRICDDVGIWKKTIHLNNIKREEKKEKKNGASY